MGSESPAALVEFATLSATLGTYHDLGATPAGQRLVVDVIDASLTGERVNATLAGSAAADWFTIGAGGVGTIDVRMTLRADDGSLLLLEYDGRTRPGREHPNLVAGHFSADVDGPLAWLNHLQIVGKGWVDAGVVVYSLYELR